jgi:hypothetical protein
MLKEIIKTSIFGKIFGEISVKDGIGIYFTMDR